MSVQAVAWAFEQEIESSGAKFVLVALANFADAEGKCYPSQRTLARMTGRDGKDTRTVRRHLAMLEEAGFIARVETRRETDGGRTSDTYWLQAPPEVLDPGRGGGGGDDRAPVRKPPAARIPPPGQNDRGAPDNLAGGPRPNWPGKNHQIEPSGRSGGGDALAAPADDRRADHHPRGNDTPTPGTADATKLLERFFGKLLDTLLTEAPARRVDWPALGVERIRAAAETASGAHHAGGVFATRLKAKLDELAGIAVAMNIPPTKPATIDDDRQRRRRQALATRESERAYDQALAAGASETDAEAAAAAAYQEALAAGDTPEVDHDQQVREAEARAAERRRQLVEQGIALTPTR